MLCFPCVQWNRLLAWGGGMEEQVKNMLMRTALAVYRANKLQNCVFRQNVFLFTHRLQWISCK